MIRLSTRTLLVLGLLFASIFPLNFFPHAQDLPAGTHVQLSGKQGEVLVVTLPVSGHPQKVVGHLLKRDIIFFPIADGEYAGLLGLDMQDRPGQHDLVIQVEYPDRQEEHKVTILLMKEDYKVQHLKLPKKMVDLDSKTLARVKKESKVLHQAFDSVVPKPLWRTGFIEPVQGRVSGRFGSRRVINGQSKRPHSGEDIAAPNGTPVVAMNSGVVRLTMDHFFTGKGVVLDHGLGLFSMYFHLADVDVSQGQMVEKGQTIGKVGATGRATGPHLHWGVRLNGSRIDPYSLLKVSVKGMS
ncbi:M23 family metallopeptidase [Candidatus Nitronereus thalassa]|uniref:M23 family metallopeptidase n=1 Tax=Candidatus Nitronereus thalassa TaxID=3020898 RepID=A0ABU3K3F5_9BACT|nr:M23 family metallopeptidase [Candidatus Nitronereus thalassa]MDT7040919.1 M23 family metallopeptidase [Candidatus Nitronereus thalassa]